MPRGPMSPAAKKKIADAQRKRWAAQRAAKAGGAAPAAKKRGRPPGSKNKRRVRPTMAESVMSLNPFLNVTIHDLVAARKNVEEAWNATLAMLGMGGGSAKGKRKPGRPRKEK